MKSNEKSVFTAYTQAVIGKHIYRERHSGSDACIPIAGPFPGIQREVQQFVYELFARLRYLIIDDFEQMRVSFKGMLTSFGAENIETCPSGEKALSALSTNSYDVVICDYNLGDGKDGQQVLEEARYLGYLGHACCFFMITAESNMPMVLSALEQQPDEYMIKPINSDALEHRLISTLKRKQQLKVVDQALMDGDKNSAIELCREQRGGNPKNNLYLAKLQAELCIDLERYDDAASIYNEMLNIRDFPWANFALAKIDFLHNDLKSAEDRFLSLTQENRYYVEAYDWLAMILEEQGDKRRSQELLQDAIKLSPKVVSRQRKLGDLALQNGDITVAARAYQAAVYWGEYSCFSSAHEYRQLADIYNTNDQQPMLLKLLSEGRKRFSRNPTNLIQILSRLVRAKLLINENDVVSNYIQQIDQLVADYKGMFSEEDLLNAADDLLCVSKSDEAKTLLGILLCNHHDNDELTAKIHKLMKRHGKAKEADTLIKNISDELKEIQDKCLSLIQDGGIEQAITMLNDILYDYPSNRTIALMSANTMINYMRERGPDQGYYFRCRHLLNHLLLRDPQDTDAEECLSDLNQIPA